MIEQIKKIKLEELNLKRTELTSNRSNITAKLDKLNENLSKLLRKQGDVALKFGVSSRRFAYDYRRNIYINAIKRIRKLISEENERVARVIEDSNVDVDLEKIEEEISIMQSTKTLFDLGFSPTEAMEFLHERGFKPVLTSEDMGIVEHPREFSSISSLICVHKTLYPPNNNQIRTAKASNAQFKETIVINGVKYEFFYESGRDTIHLSMNDEVASHMYGSWDECPYAVLIPFKDIPKETIAMAHPQDTWIRGNIDLSSDTWILCPENEVDDVQACNPNVKVVGYRSEKVQGFPRPFLTLLGYRGELVGMHSWGDEKSTNQFYELMKKEGINCSRIHSESQDFEDEGLLTKINCAVAVSKLLRDKKLLTKVEDIENISKQLGMNSYGVLIRGVFKKSCDADNSNPQAIIGNHKALEVFFNKMKENGFNISPPYQQVLSRLYEEVVNSEHDEINIPEEASEVERARIEKFLNTYRNETGEWNGFNEFITGVIGEAIIHSTERMDCIRNYRE